MDLHWGLTTPQYNYLEDPASDYRKPAPERKVCLKYFPQKVLPEYMYFILRFARSHENISKKAPVLKELTRTGREICQIAALKG